jgi:hypothetical protein
VAAPDPTFTDIVVPGAKSALDFAMRSSPLGNCVRVRHRTSHRAFRHVCLYIRAGLLIAPDSILCSLLLGGSAMSFLDPAKA